MTKHAYSDSDLEHAQSDTQVSVDASPVDRGLPNRLMTAFEVAAFVGCHEETVRRAYWRGLLKSQRFAQTAKYLHADECVLPDVMRQFEQKSAKRGAVVVQTRRIDRPPLHHAKRMETAKSSPH